MSRFADTAAAVLLGGASTRMGCDKARLEWGGRALATRQAELLAHDFDELLLVGGEPPKGTPGRAVPDPEGEPSSLRGIVGALEAAHAPWVFVVATDMPALTHELVLGLVALRSADADAVVPRTDRPQPLCALYRRAAAAPVARERFERGEPTLRGLLDALRVTWLEGADLDRVGGPDALANVNTPAEWQAFRAAAPPREEPA